MEGKLKEEYLFDLLIESKLKKRNRLQGALKEDYINTRVLSEELRLTGLPRGNESFVRIEAWFRGPFGDLYESDPGLRNRNGTDLLVLPNLRDLEKQVSIVCLCHPFEYSPVDGYEDDESDIYDFTRKVCDSAKNGGRCEQFLLTDEAINRSGRILGEIIAARSNQFSIQNSLNNKLNITIQEREMYSEMIRKRVDLLTDLLDTK